MKKIEHPTESRRYKGWWQIPDASPNHTSYIRACKSQEEWDKFKKIRRPEQPNVVNVFIHWDRSNPQGFKYGVHVAGGGPGGRSASTVGYRKSLGEAVKLAEKTMRDLV
jgi:hypothetical protein